MECIMSVMCRTGEILLGWHSMGEKSGRSLHFSGNVRKIISYCMMQFLVSVCKVAVLKGNLLHKQL